MFIKEITCILNEIGMCKKLKGYHYLLFVIDEIILGGFCPNINLTYENVGKIFGTKKENIERNIRYAIENTWEQGNVNEIYNLFGYTVDKEKGKPTNSEFIFLIADKIKLKKS
ncbi:MAG: hypothetical protein E7365_00270 [Clostridiales bacterium]|nr:hypothetical protein [Clostridiales bacterium]